MEVHANHFPNLMLPISTQQFLIKCATIKYAISTGKLKNVNTKKKKRSVLLNCLMTEVRHVHTRKGKDDLVVLGGATRDERICVATLPAPTISELHLTLKVPYNIVLEKEKKNLSY